MDDESASVALTPKWHEKPVNEANRKTAFPSKRSRHSLPKDDHGSPLLDILWSNAVCDFVSCVATV